MPLDAPQLLVVDDDDELRKALVDTLTAKGYTIAVARDGKEALERLAAGVRPDLILMDLCMPEMDGWQLRHALADQAALAGVPIIVMTAATDQNAADLAVVEVVVKPFAIDELLTVVRRHLLDAELLATAGAA